MSGDFQITSGPAPKFDPGPRDFRFQDSNDLGIAVKDSMALQANKIAEHEGKIAGLSAVVSALQSYKGFLQAVIIGLLAFTLASFAVMVTLQVRAENKTESVSGKVSALEGKVDGLPGRISRELRETSRDLVLITQGAAGSPATSEAPDGR